MICKKMHYNAVSRYFRYSAINKEGYYNAPSENKLKYDLQQYKVLNIFNSIIDQIFQKKSEIRTVLDVGCGNGDFTIDLAKKYPHLERIVGIDFIREMVKICEEKKGKVDNVYFVEADARKIPFDDRNFDVCTFINVLHHIHIDDFENVLYELTRITDKYLILDIRNKKNIFNFWYKYFAVPIFYRDLPVNECNIHDVTNLIKNQFELKIIKGVSVFLCTSRRVVLMFERIDK